MESLYHRIDFIACNVLTNGFSPATPDSLAFIEHRLDAFCACYALFVRSHKLRSDYVALLPITNASFYPLVCSTRKNRQTRHALTSVEVVAAKRCLTR